MNAPKKVGIKISSAGPTRGIFIDRAPTPQSRVHDVAKTGKMRRMATNSTGAFKTVREIAEQYRVTDDSVYLWVKSGKLGAVRLGKGGSLRIPVEELARFVQPATTTRSE